MTKEMAELYGQPDRLDRPALAPADLAEPHGDYLVGWIDGDPVAGGGVRRLDRGLAEIKRMYVTPTHRSRGIAGALLGALEARARDLGYSTARLDTGPLQPRALSVYQRAGYRAIDPYNDNPYAVFWGEKPLVGAPGG
jgi:GNAT superfamily N-acetyltransferase